MCRRPAPRRTSWYLDGVKVSGATKATFTVPATAVNKVVTVRLTVLKANNVAVRVTSAATGKVL